MYAHVLEVSLSILLLWFTRRVLYNNGPVLLCDGHHSRVMTLEWAPALVLSSRKSDERARRVNPGACRFRHVHSGRDVFVVLKDVGPMTRKVHPTALVPTAKKNDQYGNFFC